MGSAGNVNVVWQDETPSNTDIMFSHSTNAGVTFSTPTNLSNDSAESASPQIAADTAGNIYVVWEHDTLNLGIFIDSFRASGRELVMKGVILGGGTGSRRKFRAHTLPARNSWTQRASQRLARGFACASAVLLLYTPGQSRSRNTTSILEIT